MSEIRFLSVEALILVPEGPSTPIVGFQGPKTIQGMAFGT